MTTLKRNTALSSFLNWVPNQSTWANRFLASWAIWLWIFPQGLSADLVSVAGPGEFDSNTPLISEVNFSDDQIIADLEIEIRGLEYPWAGDLVLSITSPIGTQFDLVSRLGQSNPDSPVDSGSSVDFRGNYVFSDAGQSIIEAAAGQSVVPSGTYRPSTSRGEAISFFDTVDYESTRGTWTLLIEDFDAEDGGQIAGWEIRTISYASPDCDFNSDSVCNIDDLEGPQGFYSVGDIGEGVAAVDSTQRFDLTGDGSINSEDLHLFRGAAAQRNGFLQAYLLGDTNLDGEVDFTDFLRLSLGFGAGKTWASGNFRGNAATDFQDFLSLSLNFGRTIQRNETSAAVPEPAAATAVGCFFLFCAFGKLGRRARES